MREKTIFASLFQWKTTLAEYLLCLYLESLLRRGCSERKEFAFRRIFISFNYKWAFLKKEVKMFGQCSPLYPFTISFGSLMTKVLVPKTKLCSHLPCYGQIQQTTNWWYFSYFSKKMGSDTSCKLKCQILFSRRKKYFKMSSAEIFTQHAKCLLIDCTIIPYKMSIQVDRFFLDNCWIYKIYWINPT